MDISPSISTIVRQIEVVLYQLNNEEYARSLDLFNGSSIGMHIRHIHDFYATIARSYDNATLNYANRERNQEIEVNANFAMAKLHTLRDQLVNLDYKRSIKVFPDYLDDNSNQICVQSTFGRELMYAYDHAVHHLAMVKMAITQCFPTCTLDQNIGVAASTIVHKQES